MASKKMDGRLPALDGYRAVLIFIVSWYHIWQQSWWTPYWGSISLDVLVRTGYMMVDGMFLLSAFLLFLPWARARRDHSPLPDRNRFYGRRAARILPSYYFLVLAALFCIALPWGLYYSPQYAVKDIFTHLTMTFTFWADTYIGTPLGVVCWTLAIEMQMYLLFPYLAGWALRYPLRTLLGMTAAAWCFRGWCLWSLPDFGMVLNQLPSFLDVIALGMAGAFLYAWAEQIPSEGKKHIALRLAGTAGVVLGIWLLVQCMWLQARCPNNYLIQQGQLLRRFPLALVFLLILLGLPLSVKPVQWLFGNRVTRFLSGISMNYYLIHQTLAVHLKRMRIPASVAELPNQAGEMPWQMQYTFLAFGLSFLLAVAVTYGIEKPAAKYLKKKWRL